ncbi:ABC transporter substrate-binding protein [Nonomuraea dietziae]|uniref:ABC transporter substrate-binding protein n=1 Tax=Nonomuraea dietziae TaxID=65515 RepID=UPI0036151631
MRRRWLAGITMAALLGLAACGGGGGTPAPSGQASGTGGGGKQQVEVFSWWTGPGEADGLKAMKEIFEKENPNLTFFDAAVAGGSGDKAKALLQSKLQADTPPDTFQGHAGAELLGYIKAGDLEDLTFLYDELKLKDAFPAQLVEQISHEGKIYSVPVNIHRSNILWFNPSVLKEAGVAAAPKTIEEFIAALEKVKAKGKIPLSIGSEWTVTHLMESVLLGSLGTDAYNALFKPGADWGSAAVTKALNDFAKIMSYAGDPQDDWQPAAAQVAEGQAAFNIMGDWAYGYFHNPPEGGLGKKSKTDFDWALARHRGHLHVAVRQLHPAQGRQEQGRRRRVAQGRGQQGGAGRLQPEEGLHPRPQGRRRRPLHRLPGRRAEGLVIQQAGRIRPARRGRQPALARLDQRVGRSVHRHQGRGRAAEGPRRRGGGQRPVRQAR